MQWVHPHHFQGLGVDLAKEVDKYVDQMSRVVQAMIDVEGGHTRC
jgi:hypothetical protein